MPDLPERYSPDEWAGLLDAAQILGSLWRLMGQPASDRTPAIYLPVPRNAGPRALRLARTLPATAERKAEVLRLADVRPMLPYRVIAERVGLTRQRVGQIVRDTGRARGPQWAPYPARPPV